MKCWKRHDEAWLQSKTEWALATKNRYIALLKLIYRLAKRAQRIKYNPALWFVSKRKIMPAYDGSATRKKRPCEK